MDFGKGHCQCRVEFGQRNSKGFISRLPPFGLYILQEYLSHSLDCSLLCQRHCNPLFCPDNATVIFSEFCVATNSEGRVCTATCICHLFGSEESLKILSKYGNLGPFLLKKSPLYQLHLHFFCHQDAKILMLMASL